MTLTEEIRYLAVVIRLCCTKGENGEKKRKRKKKEKKNPSSDPVSIKQSARSVDSSKPLR